MRLPRAIPAWLLAAAFAIAGLSFIAWWRLQLRRAESAVPAHTYQLQPGRMNEWTRFGGKWEIADGAVKSNSYERGAKLLTGSKYWSNYTVNADIWFEGPAADMGVVIRAKDESEGVDAYNGYFVGLRSLDGTLVMGRASYSWLEVAPVTIPGGVSPFTWYRLRVTAYGCNVAASVTNLSTQQTAWIAFGEHLCIKRGRFGLRTLNAKAKWRNISVEPATWNDYHELERHAAYIEHPVIVNGPPWWTPWHVGMLFTGALTAALLIQLAYFRFKSWKANTINREREWLAHEIHDTMAQSFAGIGYQIQGIRHTVVSGDGVDSREIAGQLSVAYQLVSKCHEEASRTIAMLGSRSSSIRDDLLGTLTETAKKVAGAQIRIITEVHGSVRPLNLRVADALLHIGREAIVNAVSYSDPTLLRLTLTFDGDEVELVVEDDGRGFEYKPESAGFGILGMQKHARDVAGTLEIVSTPQNGTQVRARAMLQREKISDRILAGAKDRFWRDIRSHLHWLLPTGELAQDQRTPRRSR
jgi:signal transduction histidine kinase